MKRLRPWELDDRVFDTLRLRPRSVEELGNRLGGLTTDILLSMKRLKDKGLIHVCSRMFDPQGRPVAIYDVTRTKKSTPSRIEILTKGELRVTPV